MRAMAHELCKKGRRGVLLYSTRHMGEAAFQQDLTALAAASKGLLQMWVILTGGGAAPLGVRSGRITAKVIQELVRLQFPHYVADVGRFPWVTGPVHSTT